MSLIQQAYQALEDAVAAWAQSQPDILAVIVIGSRARLDHPADEFSDLDLMLYVQQPGLYARQRAWLDDFGQVLAASMGFAGSDPEWLVVYAGGIKADFERRMECSVYSLLPGVVENTFGVATAELRALP